MKTVLMGKALAGLTAGLALAGCASGGPAHLSMSQSSSDFRVQCVMEEGIFASHECSGKNSCKGYEFQERMGVSRHGCKHQSSCRGATCKD